MSRYPINPRTGRREPPPFEGCGQRLFEIVAVVVLAPVVITLLAGLVYACIQLWLLMFS